MAEGERAVSPDQRPDFGDADAARPRSQAALALALLLARQRAAPSSTPPGTLPVGADAASAALAVIFLDLIGIAICGTTLSSGRWAPGSLAFSAAATAGLCVGKTRDAAVMGADADAEAGAAG